jgi:hypothetical protein
MRTLDSRSRFVALALAIVTSAFACQGDEADDEAAPADTVATAPAMEEPVSSGLEPSASSTTSVMITNPMPHAMVVTVEYGGGGETELGTVPAGGEQAFSVAASGGETITLVATDDANSHSPSTTMILSAGQTEAAWTIE